MNIDINSKNYKLHEWTSSQIETFWSYESNFPHKYWGNVCGLGFVRLINEDIRTAQSILDLGCGDGSLIEQILQRYSFKDKKIYGLDLSKSSVASANIRLSGGLQGFGGAFDNISSLLAMCPNKFDLILCTEVVEHLYDNDLNRLLSDAHSLLAKGGKFIITTPNNEDIALEMISNPIDGSLFHRWQHVRSWTSRLLCQYLGNNGFNDFTTIETNVLWYNSTYIKNLYRRWRYPERRTLIVKSGKS